MGKIILTVEGTTVGTVANGGGVVIEKTVNETDSARLIAAYAQTYGVELNGAESIRAVLQAWFDGIVAGSVAHVSSVEKQVAAETASAAVTPITVT